MAYFSRYMGIAASGQVVFDTPGTYSWTVPTDVGEIGAVLVGGGGAGYQDSSYPYIYGGAGGGLRYINNLYATPGETLTVTVGAGGYNNGPGSSSSLYRGALELVKANGGAGSGGAGGTGTTIGTGPNGGVIGGGNGGNGGSASGGCGGGGGGAGGYSGNGGNGGGGGSFPSTPSAGSGGAGGGGAGLDWTSGGGGGGGVGLLGEGISGTAGVAGSGTPGGGGSYGSDGLTNYNGGVYGAGGGGSPYPSTGRDRGGDGAVRIIWGYNRVFPSTNTGNVKPILQTYGYFAGGYITATTVTTDRITFSTGVTAANTASNLAYQKYYLAGVSDGSTYGYFAGGSSASGSFLNYLDRITFPAGGATVRISTSGLSQGRGELASVSDASTYGYFTGGNTNSPVVTADRITFSTSVRAANTISNLSQVKYGLAGVSDALTYGYFAGGSSSGGGYVATADRIIFSTGATAANTTSNLSQARHGLAGVSDASTYGYFAGGFTGSYLTTADRITFSTGATAANTASNLSQARYYLAGTSDGSTYGYFAGGYTGSYVATADRITFSTGATAANTASNLSQARYGLTGVSDCSV